MPVQHECLAGQFRCLWQRQFFEIAIDKGLDATINRTLVAGQQAVLFTITSQQVARDAEKVFGFLGHAGWLAG